MLCLKCLSQEKSSDEFNPCFRLFDREPIMNEFDFHSELSSIFVIEDSS